MQVGDLVDMHNYVGPGSPVPTESRGAVLGEYGGLGLKVEVRSYVMICLTVRKIAHNPVPSHCPDNHF